MNIMPGYESFINGFEVSLFIRYVYMLKSY